MKEMTRRTFLRHMGVAGLIGATTPAAITAFDGAVMRANAQTAPGGPVGPLQMWVPNWPDLMEVGRLLTASYEKLGVTLEVQVGSMQSGLAAIVGEHKVPHMVGMSWGGSPDRIDPDFWLTEFLHSKRAQKGGLNFGAYRSAEYDALADAQRTEMDLDRRVTLVKQAQAHAARDNPSLVLLHRTTIQAYNKARWEGPVPVVGSGIALPYVPWTYIQIKPKTDRKVLRVVTTYDLVSTNPFATPEVHNVAMLRLLYPPIVVRDREARVVPWAAEKVTIVDSSTVDVMLRSGMKFHDGKPVTAEDLKFTLDFIQEKKFPAMARVADAVASAEVTGAQSARIKLKSASASFVPNVLGYAFIAPKHIWAGISGNPVDYPNDPPVGYGPFKLKEWRKGEFVTFEANKDFFMPPQINAAIWMVVPNIENQLAMIERGEIDMIGSNLDAEQGKRLALSPDLEVAKVPSHGLHEVRLNLALAPLDNPKVRLALQHGTNRKQIVDVVYSGNATVAMNSFITPDLKEWGSAAFPNPDFDIEKGRAVLKAAGFAWDSTGKLLYPKG
jgi:peptide/nickel transport system substrate-binding protein